MEYSKDKRLQEALGLREVIEGSVYLDHPQDFGYLCPTCGNLDMRWSEYNSCVWCEKCNKDIPTCLTITELDEAIDIFVRTVRDVKER